MALNSLVVIKPLFLFFRTLKKKVCDDFYQNSEIYIFCKNSEINVHFHAFTTRIGHLCSTLPQNFEETHH